MRIEKTFNINDSQSFRHSAIKTRYDITAQALSQKIEIDVPIENVNFNVGLIVGGSGTGKSTIVNEMFKNVKPCEWSNSSILENFDSRLSIEEIVQALSSVGFNCPPFWLKPFSVLSNGEKMRVQLAREILEKDLIVFDEFTSVVDREVAKATSFAIQKAVRKMNKKFVAVSCHSDIIEWLNPDWILDTNTMSFFLLKNKNDQTSNTRSESAQSLYGQSLKTITI